MYCRCYHLKTVSWKRNSGTEMVQSKIRNSLQTEQATCSKHHRWETQLLSAEPVSVFIAMWTWSSLECSLIETWFWFLLGVLYMCCSLDCRKINVWRSFIFALEPMTHRWTPSLCFWRSHTNRWRFAHALFDCYSSYSLCADTGETT